MTDIPLLQEGQPFRIYEYEIDSAPFRPSEESVDVAIREAVDAEEKSSSASRAKSSAASATATTDDGYGEMQAKQAGQEAKGHRIISEPQE